MVLNDLLEYLCKNNKLVINIHDVSGLLCREPFVVLKKFESHTNEYCDVAKKTQTGFRLCFGCKMFCCNKAANDRNYFYGMCPFGLFELVYPITYKNKVLCILFIGNQTENLQETRKKAEKACRIIKADYSHFKKEHFENIGTTDRDYMLKTAILIEECIIRGMENIKQNFSDENGLHWSILKIKDYADENFLKNITLKQLSQMYFVNEKYAGRMFNRQVGCSFHEYLNKLRLEKAAELLRKTDKNVLDIAMESGFNSISYFNRVFMRSFNNTPTAYRLEAFK